MNNSCQQLGCGKIMIYALPVPGTSISSTSRGLIVIAESYSLLYSSQSSCGSSSYEGAVYVAFKMILSFVGCMIPDSTLTRVN